MASCGRQLWARIEQHSDIFELAAVKNASDTLSPSRPSWSLLASDGAELLYVWAGGQLHCIHLRQRDPVFRHVDNEDGPGPEDGATFVETLEVSPRVPFQVTALRLHPRGQRLALAGISPDGVAGVAVVDTSVVPGLPSRQSTRDLVRIYPAMFACRPSLRVLQLAWHPLSDTHVGVLTSDGCFRLFDLAQDSDVPEQEFYLHLPPDPSSARNPPGLRVSASASSGRATAVLQGMQVVDFCFGAPGESWEMFTVFFLDSLHRVFALCPVVPFGCHVPSTAVASLWQASCSRGLADGMGNTDEDGVELDEGTLEQTRTWLRITFPALNKEVERGADESIWTEGGGQDAGDAHSQTRVWKAHGYCFEDRLPELQEYRKLGELQPEQQNVAAASSLCLLKAGSDWTILAIASEDLSVRVLVLVGETAPSWFPSDTPPQIHPSPANYVQSFAGTSVSAGTLHPSYGRRGSHPAGAPTLDEDSIADSDMGGGHEPALMLMDTVLIADEDNASAADCGGEFAYRNRVLIRGRHMPPTMLADAGTLGGGPQVFLMHSSGVHCISLPWATSLEEELAYRESLAAKRGAEGGRHGVTDDDEDGENEDGGMLGGGGAALPMAQACCLLDTRVVTSARGQRAASGGVGAARGAGEDGGMESDPPVGGAVVVEWPLGPRVVALTASGAVRVLVPPLVVGFTGDDERMGGEEASTLEAEWDDPLMSSSGADGHLAGASSRIDTRDKGLSDNSFVELSRRRMEELKELCRGPRDVPMPKAPPAARPLLSSSIEGRQFLHESCKVLRDKHVAYAHQMYGELRALAYQLRDKVELEHRALDKLKGMAETEQRRGDRLKARLAVMANFHKNMVERLRVLGELDNLRPRPLADGTRFMAELANMERALPDLDELTEELQQRAEKLSEVGGGNKQPYTPLPASQATQVFQALEEETRLIEQAKELIVITKDELARRPAED
eukprot:jgi/Mesvir1/26848/Mv20599-RA.1